MNTTSWDMPPVFSLLQRLGRMSARELRRTFNIGIGMVLVVSERRLAAAEKTLRRAREPFVRIGTVVELPSNARKRVIYR